MIKNLKTLKTENYFILIILQFVFIAAPVIEVPIITISNSEDEDNVMGENQEIQEYNESLCRVCLARDHNFDYTCGHRSCIDCARVLIHVNDRCPVCRRDGANPLQIPENEVQVQNYCEICLQEVQPDIVYTCHRTHRSCLNCARTIRLTTNVCPFCRAVGTIRLTPEQLRVENEPILRGNCILCFVRP